MNPTRAQFVTIFGMEEIFLSYDNLDSNLFPFVEFDMYLFDANHIPSSSSADVIQKESIQCHIRFNRYQSLLHRLLDWHNSGSLRVPEILLPNSGVNIR